jgi:hypothetical protein
VKFFNDPDVQKFLAEEYGLRVEIYPYGSIESLCGKSLDGIDFIWAGDQSSLDIYRKCGGTQIRTENIYNSPIVLYSWAPVADALIAAGVAQIGPDGVYTVDLAKLTALIQKDTTWSSIGLPDFYGQVKIKATDPSRSNSGFQYAGLLANVLNGGSQVDANSVIPLLPEIAPFFRGYMAGTSAAFFNQYMTQGMGALPIAIGYESQMIEYFIENPSMRAQVTQDVRMLYPTPTVWASHPFIARTDNGVRLLEVLLDSDAQRLAWEHHGNRPGVPGIQINTAATGLAGIKPTISSVVDMPSTDVMEMILAAIAEPSSSVTPSPPASIATATPIASG